MFVRKNNQAVNATAFLFARYTACLQALEHVCLRGGVTTLLHPGRAQRVTGCVTLRALRFGLGVTPRDGCSVTEFVARVIGGGSGIPHFRRHSASPSVRRGVSIRLIVTFRPNTDRLSGVDRNMKASIAEGGGLCYDIRSRGTAVPTRYATPPMKRGFALRVVYPRYAG